MDSEFQIQSDNSLDNLYYLNSDVTASSTTLILTQNISLENNTEIILFTIKDSQKIFEGNYTE